MKRQRQGVSEVGDEGDMVKSDDDNTNKTNSHVNYKETEREME